MKSHVSIELLARSTLFLLAGAFLIACGKASGPGGAGGADGSGGGGATTYTPPPTCSGTPEPCSLMGSAQCGHFGCYMNGTCSGDADDCFTITESLPCDEQEGCTWGASCTGSATTCDQLDASIACGDQMGCSWTPGCVGTVWSCDMLLTATDCAALSGCFWQ